MPPSSTALHVTCRRQCNTQPAFVDGSQIGFTLLQGFAESHLWPSSERCRVALSVGRSPKRVSPQPQKGHHPPRLWGRAGVCTSVTDGSQQPGDESSNPRPGWRQVMASFYFEIPRNGGYLIYLNLVL